MRKMTRVTSSTRPSTSPLPAAWVSFAFPRLAALLAVAALGVHAFAADAADSASGPTRPSAEAEATVQPDGLSDGALAAIRWQSDYGEAVRQAKREGRMLLIYFECPEGDKRCRRFQSEVLGDADVIADARNYVCVKVPTDIAVETKEGEVTLLKHPAFREMLGRPGVAIIDYANRDRTYYRRVVSTFPLARNLSYTPRRMRVILNLPPGTLTQRTLIYAVRIHPEAPRSTDGDVHEYLLHEASSHSKHQAEIQLQGHHNWDARFHRINRKLPGGLLAVEVCAESWPGERLVEAAIECVRSWRYSSGHWSAVRQKHRVYGYDMRRGRNGIWYATGIFGKR